MFARELAQQIGGQDRGIAERFVESRQESREDIAHVEIECLLVVAGADAIATSRAYADLVEARLIEADGERLDRRAGDWLRGKRQTALESIPPLRNTPSGTSLISRRVTACDRQMPQFLYQRGSLGIVEASSARCGTASSA